LADDVKKLERENPNPGTPAVCLAKCEEVKNDIERLRTDALTRKGNDIVEITKELLNTVTDKYHEQYHQRRARRYKKGTIIAGAGAKSRPTKRKSVREQFKNPVSKVARRLSDPWHDY
jgi:hypothetical protein